MKKSKQLDNILTNLDSLHSTLKRLKVSKSTLDTLNKLCEEVELDLRQAVDDDEKLDC